jgi:hypothetical protein
MATVVTRRCAGELADQLSEESVLKKRPANWIGGEQQEDGFGGEVVHVVHSSADPYVLDVLQARACLASFHGRNVVEALAMRPETAFVQGNTDQRPRPSVEHISTTEK